MIICILINIMNDKLPHVFRKKQQTKKKYDSIELSKDKKNQINENNKIQNNLMKNKLIESPNLIAMKFKSKEVDKLLFDDQKTNHRTTFVNINKASIHHNLIHNQVLSHDVLPKINKNVQTKYAILLDNKIIKNIESMKKFHETIINSINKQIHELNVIYDLSIDELKKNDMYDSGNYLVVNNNKMFLTTKSKTKKNTWGYSIDVPSLIIDKEWTLIEKL
jgi:hypothetical protein